MIGKVIEGRYAGASVNKLPDKNILFIITEDGTKVALSKSNVIAIDDITEQYASGSQKVLMVMWNDFETSILQLGGTPHKKAVNDTGSNSIATQSQERSSSSTVPQMPDRSNNKTNFEIHRESSISDTTGHTQKNTEVHKNVYTEDDKHSKQKQDSNRTSTDPDNNLSTHTIGTGIKVVLICLCVGLLLVGVFIKATIKNISPEAIDMTIPTEDPLTNRIEAFNALFTILTEESDLDDAEKRTYIEGAGLDYQTQEPFSKTLVDGYISMYSVDAFVEKLYTIYDEEYYSWDCTKVENEVKCEYQMVNDMLLYALETNGIELMDIKLPPEGSEGFYTDFPEMVPETKTTEKTGKFYNSSGENVRYETRTCTTIGTAHGDFATMREEGYSYDEGRYGWQNGVFYDELPSWKHYDNTYYYYKGVRLGKFRLSSVKYFVLGDCTYFLLPPENCDKENHGRREWLKVDVDEEALGEQLRRINIVKETATEEMRTFIPEVLKENGMDALYEAACAPDVWDSLTITYRQKKIENDQFLIDVVYGVKIDAEYVVMNIQLTGNLTEDSFNMTAVGINVSDDATLYLDYATPELAYATAEDSLAQGKTVEAAMFFGRAGDHSDAAERSFELWNKTLKPEYIGAGSYHVVAIAKDGTVVGIGNNNNRAINVSDWQNIRTLSVGNGHTVGLTNDGDVVAVGQNISKNSDLFGWENIVAISAGNGFTMGLKNDGTVVTEGHVYSANYDTTKWTNITAISAGYEHAVGLRANGTVVAVGDNEFGELDVSQWTDIIAVSAGVNFTIGLKSDGTVVATGNNYYGQCDVSQWADIVAISAGYTHTVGLKANGTVVATEWHNRSPYPNMWYNGQSNVDDWNKIVSISAGWDYTIGLKSNGTVVAVGENNRGQCGVKNLPKIKTP